MCNTIHITLRSSGGVFLVLKDKYTLAPISRKKDFGAFLSVTLIANVYKNNRNE